MTWCYIHNSSKNSEWRHLAFAGRGRIHPAFFYLVQVWCFTSRRFT
jgi:hypothetical protein